MDEQSLKLEITNLLEHLKHCGPAAYKIEMDKEDALYLVYLLLSNIEL